MQTAWVLSTRRLTGQTTLGGNFLSRSSMPSSRTWLYFIFDWTLLTIRLLLLIQICPHSLLSSRNAESIAYTLKCARHSSPHSRCHISPYIYRTLSVLALPFLWGNKHKRSTAIKDYVCRLIVLQSKFIMYQFFISLLVTVLASSARATSVFSPARPPAIPLAVKSPYLSTWLSAGSDGGNGGYLAGEWPIFWS